ncbi:hypothetical protein JOC77_004151 [Peribacillus deserti]|uniref:Uncharacterized protein n=1 Tax=Peribacillus deserti TaxID=673318 RepID=A0ABS2QND6_9BACI|nr:hypothetical protein [Peribacillus deserti]MBM7694674.1 hypothetical protein [Peribacillus deserti]
MSSESFKVSYFSCGNTVGEYNIQNWNAYSNALKVSNSVTIKGFEYEIKDINLFHNDTYLGSITELHIEVEALRL